MIHKILQEISSNPLSIITPDGETKTISFSSEVIEVLTKESWRIRELQGLLENLQYAREARELAERNGNINEIERTKQYYTHIINKISIINSASPESRHAQELILGTEPYRYLTNATISDLIMHHLRPLLLENERRRDLAIQFCAAFDRKTKAQQKTGEIGDERIKLSTDAYLVPEEFFTGSIDAEMLVTLMGELHANSSSHPDIDLMEEKEFLIYCLTKHPYFTFDLQKAINHKSSNNYPLFYIGKDRKKITDQWKID